MVSSRSAALVPVEHIGRSILLLREHGAIQAANVLNSPRAVKA